MKSISLTSEVDLLRLSVYVSGDLFLYLLIMCRSIYLSSPAVLYWWQCILVNRKQNVSTLTCGLDWYITTREVYIFKMAAITFHSNYACHVIYHAAHVPGMDGPIWVYYNIYFWTPISLKLEMNKGGNGCIVIAAACCAPSIRWGMTEETVETSGKSIGCLFFLSMDQSDVESLIRNHTFTPGRVSNVIFTKKKHPSMY